MKGMEMLYEVAVLEIPTAEEKKQGESEKLVFGPVAVVAKDDRTAAIKAVMGNPTGDINQDKMQVLVRPFA